MGALGSLKRRLQLPTNLDDLGRNPQQGGGGVPSRAIVINGTPITINGNYILVGAA